MAVFEYASVTMLQCTEVCVCLYVYYGNLGIQLIYFTGKKPSTCKKKKLGDKSIRNNQITCKRICITVLFDAYSGKLVGVP